MSDRWTIYVCPECGRKLSPECPAHPFAKARRVEVCPVSELEQGRRELEFNENVTVQELQEMWAECARLAGAEVVDTGRGVDRALSAVRDLRRDYDRFLEFVREVAKELRGFVMSRSLRGTPSGEQLGIAASDELFALADRLDPKPYSTCGNSGEVRWLANPPDPQTEESAPCPDCEADRG